MKHILNVLKNEIFIQNKESERLVEKVAASQQAFLADRTNECLYNDWSNQVKELQKRESNLRYLKSAYITMCNACEVEPMSVEDILAEKGAKQTKKSSRDTVKKTVKKDEKPAVKES